eukprot:1183104-Prymnesium_polylepis.1
MDSTILGWTPALFGTVWHSHRHRVARHAPRRVRVAQRRQPPQDACGEQVEQRDAVECGGAALRRVVARELEQAVERKARRAAEDAVSTVDRVA